MEPRLCLSLITAAQFQTTVTTTTVCLQRCRSSRVLGEEVRARNSTPAWTALVESSSYVFSLPYRHSAVIPRRDPPLDCRRGFTSASSECLDFDADDTVHTTHHAGWSSLPGRCCSCVECSSAVCWLCAIAAAVPPRPEDGTVPVVVLFTM